MTDSRSQPMTEQEAAVQRLMTINRDMVKDEDFEAALRKEFTAVLASARRALELAEDVLSRAPFSTGIWPNGMHPNAGIEQIRAALKDITP